MAQTEAASSAPTQSEESTGLRVGVKVAPPFVIEKGGQYSGLAIDLWENVAAERGWAFEYTSYDLQALLEAVTVRDVDVGLGAITATAEREQHMDFSHPITSSPEPAALPL